MTEVILFSLPFKRFFRSLGHYSELSWLLLAAVLAGGSLLAFGSYRLGLNSPEIATTAIGYFLSVSFLGGLWLGFARVDGQRPIRWRLASRTAWFFFEQSRGLLFLTLLGLLTVVSFCIGVATQSGAPWWQTVIESVGLLALTVGVALLGSCLTIAVKIISQNILVRMILLILVVYSSMLVIGQLGGIISALADSWFSLQLNVTFTAVFLSIGVLGVAAALSELLLAHYHVRATSRRRYWPLRLPTAAMGGFGAGTALFVSEISYYLRSSRFQRRFLACIVILGLGLVTLNLFTTSYRANAEILFYALTGTGVSFLAATIGFGTGSAAEKRVQRFQNWPVSSKKIRISFWAASLSVTLIVAVIIIELFAVNVVSTSQLFLLLEASLLSTLVGYTAGQAGEQLRHGLHDPLIHEVVNGLLILLLVTFGGILLFFQDIVSPLTTALTLCIWALGAWLIAERQRRMATNG